MKRFVIVAALLAPCGPANAQTGIARAVDGDTLAIGTERIRLFGIDAPEARQTCRVNWSEWTCGLDAATALRSMVEGKQVACEPIDKDVYGRTVARCHVGQLDVAAEMVRKGLAVAYGDGGNLYGGIEAISKAQKRGIWASEFEMPRAYRDAHPREPQGQPRMVDRPGTNVVRHQPRAAASAFYSCAAARAAGAAPMYRGQPGYNPNLDGDHDGIACEPYRGKR